MNDRKENTHGNIEAEMADKLYKNLKMGTDSIVNLMPKIAGKSENIKADMTVQLDGYEKLASKARKILIDNGKKPSEENIMTKMGAKMGIMMNTAMDATPSHIAQMMIEGSTMAITDTLKLKHEYERTQTPPSTCLSIADELVRFEQGNIEKMKKYL
ncbi:MAG: hypothetical protein E7589_04520 [Ruminococcaceae bacterium]|nr:hypothetical protein [Oscillospiraceae bacterium]